MDNLLIYNNLNVWIICFLIIVLPAFFSNKKMAQNVIGGMTYYKNKYSWDSVAKRMLEIIRQDGYAI